MRFSLTKWYLDLVTDDGRVAIVYWGSVHVAGLTHAVSSILTFDGRRAASAFTLRAVPGPILAGTSLRWTCAPLHLDLELERLDTPCTARLLETPAGVLDWCAEAPRAHVRIRRGDDVLEGLGYAERLEVGVAPWKLPIGTLRWGRWTAPRRSAVWIVWEGPHPLRVGFVDAVRTTDVAVHRGVVALGPTRLALSDGTVITSATLGHQLGALVPLRSLVERVAGNRQTRWRARGVVRREGGGEDTGWVVHEEVQWGSTHLPSCSPSRATSIASCSWRSTPASGGKS